MRVIVIFPVLCLLGMTVSAQRVEMGVADSFVVNGITGSKTDPDANIKGYTLFGTNGTGAMVVTSGAGNVFVQSNLEVGVSLTVQGKMGIATTNPASQLSVATNAFQVNSSGDVVMVRNVPYSWPTSQSPTNGFLANSGSGSLAWDTFFPTALTFQTASNLVWTAQPAALTEFIGNIFYRTKADLSNANQARLTVVVRTIGRPTAEIRVQYSTDQTTWYYLDNVSGPGAVIGVAGLIVSPWVNLVAGAKADVFLRLTGINGNAILSPAFGMITVQFR